MSLYRKDEKGNISKIAGYLVQRWNDRIFNTVHSYSANGLTEYYDITNEASDYITSLTDYTEFALMLHVTNTTRNVFVRFKGISLKVLQDNGELINIGALRSYIKLFTLGASINGNIYYKGIGDYRQLYNIPERNGIVIINNQTNRNLLGVDTIPIGYQYIDGQPIDYSTSTEEKVMVQLGEIVNIKKAEKIKDDKDLTLRTENVLRYGQNGSQIVMISNSTPLWGKGGNFYRLATEEYVDEKAAQDNYNGIITFAISTWSPVLINTTVKINDTAVALDTKLVYTALSSGIANIINWRVSTNKLDTQHGDYWIINDFPEYNNSNGKIIWNVIPEIPKWDLFVSRGDSGTGGGITATDGYTIITNPDTRRIEVARLPGTLTFGYKNIGTNDPINVTKQTWSGSENIELIISPSTDDFNLLTIGTDGRPYVAPNIVADDGSPETEQSDVFYDDGNII